MQKGYLVYTIVSSIPFHYNHVSTYIMYRGRRKNPELSAQFTQN